MNGFWRVKGDREQGRRPSRIVDVGVGEGCERRRVESDPISVIHTAMKALDLKLQNQRQIFC